MKCARLVEIAKKQQEQISHLGDLRLVVTVLILIFGLAVRVIVLGGVLLDLLRGPQGDRERDELGVLLDEVLSNHASRTQQNNEER